MKRSGERTRAPLAQKKVQRFKLGKPENLTLKVIQKGEAIRVINGLTHKANIQATELATLYRNKGMTYAQIADKLNQTHYQTRINKQFDGKAVYRLLQRVTI
ncbi:hypothetical protein [Spirosoma arboris]|uniref:hypothetical protein n=1 Tax=Spirosoma arboris TaxID=2682092 RepID=UPI001D0FF793|nr:hypothetical protein [Spirosoma arboris]